MKRKVIVLLLLVLVGLMPIILTSLFRPKSGDIIRKGCIKVGTIETKSGNEIEINIIWGDVFAPRLVRKDIGFDLVGVSCYFDPINYKGEAVLPINPLLNDALIHSARDTSEYFYFVNHLFFALNQSRSVVACFLTRTKDDQPCEGDQIVPYIWVAYDKAPMHWNQGVKYIAAIPLFDPSVITEEHSEDDIRGRLADNVEAAVRRLVGFTMDTLQPTVKSIGLAAFGSTSHRGGDSPFFLDFSSGYLTILQGIKTSKTPESLDRAYLIAYKRHKGVFKEDAIRGLQSVADYMTLLKLVSTPGITIVFAIYSVLWFCISVLLYRNIKQIWKQGNRWNLIAVIVAPNPFLVTLTWGSVSVVFHMLHPRYYENIYWLNIVMTLICALVPILLSKRWPKPSRS